MDDLAFLSVQRSLRATLLDGAGAIAWQRGRDLAARLLLCLDDGELCWRTAINWIVDNFDVDRADGGVGSPSSPSYVLGQVESMRSEGELPSVRSIVLPSGDPALQDLWYRHKPAIYVDLVQGGDFDVAIRTRLLGVGTRSKIVAPLRSQGEPFALVCIDRTRADRWTGDDYDAFASVARDVLSPILGVCEYFGREAGAAQSRTQVKREDLMECLTPAESRVMTLASAGLSYKEIARRLQRSTSTIDHQLRSIRKKLGVRTSSKLVRLLD